MKRSIISIVCLSSILIGCGSSSSGSSSNSPLVTAEYTFQFVQLAEEAEGTSTSCTLFDVADQTDGMQTYAKLAQDVTVKTYDENGNFVKDLSASISNSGILTISENDIVNDGYISIIDSPSDNDKYYKVLSIQKALLDDFIIEVNRPQGNVSCYTDDQITLDTGYASVNINGIGADDFAFDSSQSALSPVAYTSQEVSAYSDESVLVRAYDNDELVDYAFVSTLTTTQYDSATPLLGLELYTYDWSILLSGEVLTNLSIRLNKGDYSYPWIDATFDQSQNTTTAFAYVGDQDSWNYRAEGTYLNWSFEYNDSLSDNLDLELPAELTITDEGPSIIYDNSNYVFQRGGIDSTINRLQRSEYDLTYDNSSNTLNHVIYSEVASGGDVVIPQLGLDNLDDPTDADNISVAVLSADSLTTDLKKFFMYKNSSSDLVSTVLPPALTAENNKTKYMDTYVLIER